MASEPTGRALAEAAARAMGWRKDEDFGTWIDTSGEIQGTTEYAVDWTEPMLAWLHERGKHGAQVFTSSTAVAVECELVLGDRSEEMGQTFYYGPAEATTCGPTLRDALMRLVVAVAEREATNG